MTFDAAKEALCRKHPKLRNDNATVEIKVRELWKLLEWMHGQGKQANTGDRLFDTLFGGR